MTAAAPMTETEERKLRSGRRLAAGDTMDRMWATIDTLRAELAEIRAERDRLRESLYRISTEHLKSTAIAKIARAALEGR